MSDLPPALSRTVASRMKRLGDEDVVRRIWDKDHTVWQDDPTEITDRMGWLTVPETMRDRVLDLKRFAEECASDRLATAVLAGM